MVKVVVNKCYGGFRLSKAGQVRYKELHPEGKEFVDDRSGTNFKRYKNRSDPYLIAVVEELGAAAGRQRTTALTIEEIPDEYKDCFEIDSDDGIEEVCYEPAQLQSYLLSTMNIDELSDVECRQMLVRLKQIGVELV